MATAILPAQVENVRSPEFKIIYSNNLKFGSSPVEIRVTFNAFVDEVGLGRFVNREEVCIVISPGAIRPMLTFLEEQLKLHEAKFGPLPAKLPTPIESN